MLICSIMYAETIKTAELNGANSTKRSKRSVNTRNTVLDAAVALYQVHGVDKTSTSAVIEKSGVGRTTFYRHFKDRDDLLNQALMRDFDELMSDFEAQTRHYASLETQIEEDMIWFLDQFAVRPALSLLFSDIEWQGYQQTAQSLASFRRASLACAKPTFERARDEGRLREGIGLDQYIDWASFVVISMQVVKLPVLENRVRSREMLRNFLVPSLISVDR
ncbi:MAG: TetR/AcrR family transcriptional regulator [Gammaproteobacteria bacterium]|nr:TetR/AcrR family transcriptional regulator [Gammaproteobacteria bacterium]